METEYKTIEHVRVLAVIPARGGSKGIPHKNIALLGSKPLLYYSLRAAKESISIDACIVSTDDLDIATAAEAMGSPVPFMRPAELSTDSSRDIDVMQHALSFVEKEYGWRPEIIVMLPPTTPTRTGADIDSALKFMEETNADSVRTVIDPSPFNPFKMWTPIDQDITELRQIFPENGTGTPRQLLPKYFMPFGLVYATRAEHIRAGKTWGDNVRFQLCDRAKFVDIDTPADLIEAERIMNQLQLLA